MLSCDLIVSCASTKFATAYAGIGLTPDCGLSYLLPRVVGQQRALELLTTNRVLTAQESLDWGLIPEVRDDADARGRAEELAEVLAAGPAFALGQAKRLVRTSWETTRAAVGRDEARTIGRAFEHPHAQHRIREFLLR